MSKYVYYDKVWDTYRVQKTVNGKKINYGTYHNEEDAVNMVSELIKHDWDKKQLNNIKSNLKIPITRKNKIKE